MVEVVVVVLSKGVVAEAEGVAGPSVDVWVGHSVPLTGRSGAIAGKAAAACDKAARGRVASLWCVRAALSRR